MSVFCQPHAVCAGFNKHAFHVVLPHATPHTNRADVQSYKLPFLIAADKKNRCSDLLEKRDSKIAV
jgi:hypothetical protein